MICGDHLSLTGGQRRAAGLRFHDRLFEHRLVKLEADFADMAGLLVADEIAGAANVEIVAGELKAGAQRVEIEQDLETLIGGLGGDPVAGVVR